MFLRQLFLLTVSNFLLTVSNFLLTVSKFLLTVSKFLLTVSNSSLTVSNFTLCAIHMIIAPAYASRCVTTTQNGSDFHLHGTGITCFHLIHDSLTPNIEKCRTKKRTIFGDPRYLQISNTTKIVVVHPVPDFMTFPNQCCFPILS